MFRFRRPHRDGALLILILCVAALLRFMGLSFQSCWSDELFSAFVSDPAHSLEEVYLLTVTDVHPPVYQALLWVWYRILGYQEITGRMLSAGAGTVGVFGVYLLGREVFGRRAGLYAAWIAALNVFLIYYSQETRSYALLFTLSTFSCLFFVRTVYAPRVGNLVGYVLCACLAANTHHFGLVLAGAQAVYLAARLIFVSKSRWRLVGYAGVVIVAVGASLWPQLGYMTRDATGEGGWITNSNLSALGLYFFWYVESPVLVGLFAVLLILAARRLGSSEAERECRGKVLLLFSCVVLCYALAVTVSLTVVPVMSMKNTIIVVPALVVLVAGGVDSLRRDALRRGVVLGIVLLSAGHLFLEPGYYTTKTKADWRSAAREIHRTDPDAPLYGVWRAGERLNVYFQWLDLEMDVERLKVLRERLHEREAPEVFWLLGPGEAALVNTGVGSLAESSGLVEIGRIERPALTAILARAPAKFLKRPEDLGEKGDHERSR